jgi:glycosyltransferase involved in cell wall biosynthesis
MMVSVWITTYNHENYIAEAIEGVLRQVTTFDYEIVIGEDCSDDNTRAIVIAYRDKYPDKIRLFLPPKNIGMNPMFYATYPLCTGKYIAWLDGDDYWTSSDKLQKQVDFLERNPDRVMCFHRIRMVNEMLGNSYDSGHPSRASDDTLTQDHFVDSVNPVYAPSVVHRNVLGSVLPPWFFQLPFPDLGFYFLFLQHGKIQYLPEVMSVYRIHKAGAYQGNSVYNNLNKFVLFFQTVLRNLELTGTHKIRHVICKFSLRLLHANLKSGNLEEARKNLAALREYRFEGILDHEWLLLRTVLLMLFKFPLMVMGTSRAKNKALKGVASGLLFFCLERVTC